MCVCDRVAQTEALISQAERDRARFAVIISHLIRSQSISAGPIKAGSKTMSCLHPELQISTNRNSILESRQNVVVHILNHVISTISSCHTGVASSGWYTLDCYFGVRLKKAVKNKLNCMY